MFESLIDLAKKEWHTLEILSIIKTGKEAEVYRGLLDGEWVAIKIYKPESERAFRKTTSYIGGKYYKSPSMRKAITSRWKFGKNAQQELWIQREFFLLQQLYELKINTPRPILLLQNAIIMELLWDAQQTAPRLIDTHLQKNQAKKFFELIIKDIKKMWQFGISHADLSEYNILVWNDLPYIIDFPQSIDKRVGNIAEFHLQKDIENITKYFGKHFPTNKEDVKQFIIS